MSTIMDGDGNYACVLLRNLISKGSFNLNKLVRIPPRVYAYGGICRKGGAP